MLGFMMMMGMLALLLFGGLGLTWLYINRPHYFKAVVCLFMGGVLFFAPRSMRTLGLLPEPVSKAASDVPAQGVVDSIAMLDQVTTMLIQYGGPFIAVMTVLYAVMFARTKAGNINEGSSSPESDLVAGGETGQAGERA